MTGFSSLAERALRSRLAALRAGALVLREGGGAATFGDPAAAPLEIVVRDRRFYAAVILGGSLGAAEAYTQGWWTTGDLTGVVRLLLRNRGTLERLDGAWARGAGLLRRLGYRLQRNTPRGSRRNIRAHYDLGNEFFALFLDDTLTYSCGLFERPDASLRDASIAKYDRMAALLDLRPGDHVVEIGTGWGGFAVHAARRFGCRVTTTTISAQQARLARQRVADAGLADRVTVLERDYRDLEGAYDKLVSIEMIEAVGHEYVGPFFAKCSALLKPSGRAAIQAITIPDERYDYARREVDFIKRYIFPGGCLPSLAVLRRAAAATDLRLERVDEIGLHYAETLRRWRADFTRNREAVAALGFDERFRRIWEFYFCYCEGAFLERAIGDVQLAYAKPAAAAPGPVAAPPAPPDAVGVAA
jgi:cyclopropane-fatty-acyl-phospholipid synthase